MHLNEMSVRCTSTYIKGNFPMRCLIRFESKTIDMSCRLVVVKTFEYLGPSSLTLNVSLKILELAVPMKYTITDKDLLHLEIFSFVHFMV